MLTVTIGIPAHNEEKNIAQLLRALSKQDQEGYKLEALYIVCDGCTDKIAATAISTVSDKSYAYVINDGLRKGQAQRLNELYQICKSDIFITFDADIKITDPLLVSKLIAPFSDPQVGLVGGNDLPSKPKTMVQRALQTYEFAWKSITQRIKQGNNVHNHPGRISAVRTQLIKDHPLPNNIVANDHYLYFFALQQGWKFVFAKDAVIYFQLPSSLKEFLLQGSRFINSQDNILSYFNLKAEAEYDVSRKSKLRAYGKYLLKKPFWMSCALALQILLVVALPFLEDHGKKQLWSHISSSKEYTQ